MRKNDRKSRSNADRELRQTARLARVLQVLELIQSKGRWNARQIAHHLECSERTVYRDLKVLELAGVPWHFDEGDRCYRVRSGFRFPPLDLTRDELLGQAAATVIAKAKGIKIGRGADPVTQKLLATGETATAKLLRDATRLLTTLDLKLAGGDRHLKMMETIQWALVEGKQLKGVYRSASQGRQVKLTLHPYRLCLSRQAWYLIARPTDEQAPKTYRVPRFESLRATEKPAEVPDGFDLRWYFGNAWGVFRGDESYEVVLHFTKAIAPIVLETTWHHTQRAQRHRDGSVTLSFDVDGLEEILWWVVGWTGGVRVVMPEQLREMLVNELRAALKLNGA